MVAVVGPRGFAGVVCFPGSVLDAPALMVSEGFLVADVR